MKRDIDPNIEKTSFSCSRDNLIIRGHIYRAAQTETATEAHENAAESQKSPVIIMSHGFLGNENHFIAYAEAIAKIGYIAVTFDFNGGGPKSTSSGKSIDMTVLTEKADLLAVIKYVESLEYVDKNNISLMGFSQGGFVSAMTAAELNDRIKQLVLFYPALCIPDDARNGKMLMISFDPQDIPPVICQDPMTVGRNYAVTAQKLDAYKEISGFTGRTLIIHGTEDKAVNIEYSRRAKKVYKNLVYKELEGADHGFFDADETEAIRILLDFCKL